MKAQTSHILKYFKVLVSKFKKLKCLGLAKINTSLAVSQSFTSYHDDSYCSWQLIIKKQATNQKQNKVITLLMYKYSRWCPNTLDKDLCLLTNLQLWEPITSPHWVSWHININHAHGYNVSISCISLGIIYSYSKLFKLNKC